MCDGRLREFGVRAKANCAIGCLRDRLDMRKGAKLSPGRKWIIGDAIGAGGFGSVYVVTSEGEEAAAKLVPKDPGADRELLFADLVGVRNIVPIIDSGETAGEWVLVMPLA